MDFVEVMCSGSLSEFELIEVICAEWYATAIEIVSVSQRRHENAILNNINTSRGLFLSLLIENGTHVNSSILG